MISQAFKFVALVVLLVFLGGVVFVASAYFWDLVARALRKIRG
jgi:hypothetical protein